MKNVIAIVLLLSFCSCSFKPDEKGLTKKDQTESSLEFGQDSDGDGMTDEKENMAGSDPFIADLPQIKGNFFQELSVEIDLFNSSSNRFEQLKWNFENGKIHFSWNETSFESPGGSIYMESILKAQAFAVDFKRIDFKFYDYKESIYSFSSPQINEAPLGEISEKIIQFKRQGFEVYSAQTIILNRFKIVSNRFTSFRKPLFDLYFKPNKQEALIYLDSRELDGTYTFNEEHEAYVDFQTRNPEIINEALINGGGRFFIKLRDFTIYENGKTYSDLIKKVITKSVPVTISFMEKEGKSPSSVETIYVGINGGRSNLTDILKKGFKDKILMTETSIDQIRGQYNRIRSSEDYGKNETLRWFVGAEFVSGSIFQHEFRPNEGIGLAYFSDKNSENMPLYASRAILNNNQLASSGKLPITTNTVKIRIIPQLVQVPTPKIVRVSLPHCGKGNWEINEVNYDKTVVGLTDKRKDFAENFLNDAFIRIHTIKGNLIEGNVGILSKRKFLKVTKADSEWLNLELLDSINNQITNSDLQITIDISLSPTSINIQDGALSFISKNCVRSHNDPPRGADGGRGGGGNKIKNQSLSGTGFSEEAVTAKYDLNVHFFSY